MSKTNQPLEKPHKRVHYCPRCRDELKNTLPIDDDFYWCDSCHICWEILDYPDIKTWGENCNEQA